MTEPEQIEGCPRGRACRLLRAVLVASVFSVGIGGPFAVAAQTGSDDSGSSSKEALPELEAAPEEGVDPDIDRAFDRARTHLEEGEPERAAWEMRSIFLSADRFTQAQRSRRRLEARKILLEAARRMASNGNRSGALQAYDAAWLLGERGVMPDYARLLVRHARDERDRDPSEALFMAHRAQRVDPGYVAAAELDRELTRDPFTVPAYVAAGIGVAGLIGAILFKSRLESARRKIESSDPISRERLDGLVSTYRTNRTFFGISAGVAGLGLAAGSVLFSIDVADVEPVSPTFLPGLPTGDLRR